MSSLMGKPWKHNNVMRTLAQSTVKDVLTPRRALVPMPEPRAGHAGRSSDLCRVNPGRTAHQTLRHSALHHIPAGQWRCQARRSGAPQGCLRSYVWQISGTPPLHFYPERVFGYATVMRTWERHDPDPARPVAAPLDRCAELLGVELARVQEAAANVEPYLRADGTKVWSLMQLERQLRPEAFGPRRPGPPARRRHLRHAAGCRMP
jgi:hypothetical protein